MEVILKFIFILFVISNISVILVGCSEYVYEHLGCWNDEGSRVIKTQLANVNSIEECHELALAKGWSTFAIQAEKQCFSSADALQVYAKLGESDKCANGKGGAWSNDVYRAKELRANIALNKETVQSSSKDNSQSSNAVDGNTNGDLNDGGSCSITLDGQSQWWAVDLGEVSIIRTLFIYRRTDGADTGKKMNNLEVRIADNLPKATSDFDQMKLCAHNQVGRLPAKQSIYCKDPYTTGKVVILKSLKDDEMEICEVVITGFVLSYTMTDFLFDADDKSLSAFEKDADGCLGVEEMLAENSRSDMLLTLTLARGFETAIIWISSENVLHEVPKAECATIIPAFIYASTNEKPPRSSKCRLVKVKGNMFCFKCNCKSTPCTILNYYISKLVLLENSKICSIDVYIQ